MPERFSASVAGRHMECHASANLEKAIIGYEAPVDDRTANNAANRGTARHEIFAKIMEMQTADVRAFSSAVDYVARLRSTRRFKVLVEQSIQVSWLATTPDTTVDLVLYTQDEIHVLDLKTGKIPVEVVGNEQLLYYGACFAPLAPLAKGVTLHIVQPWADGNQSWFVNTLELKKFIADAQAAEAAIQAGDVTFGPSHHCTFCPANPHSRGKKGTQMCPAMMRMLYPPAVNEDEILGL
jgi:hypothetical protein